jgi:hypothetical protein
MRADDKSGNRIEEGAKEFALRSSINGALPGSLQTPYVGAPALLHALIHPSAWKGNSANFALTEFYEVSSAWGCTPHTARYLADRVLLATEGV